MKTNQIEQLKKIATTANLPTIFKLILETQEVLAEGEHIIDSVFVDRDGYEIVGSTIKKFSDWQPATLIIATNYGLTVLTEGGVQIAESFYGYRIRHTVFDKISSIALDICVLDGSLSISTTTHNDPDTIVSFNTASYFKEFERLVATVRNQMFRACCKD